MGLLTLFGPLLDVWTWTAYGLHMDCMAITAWPYGAWGCGRVRGCMHACVWGFAFGRHVDATEKSGEGGDCGLGLSGVESRQSPRAGDLREIGEGRNACVAGGHGGEGVCVRKFPCIIWSESSLLSSKCVCRCVFFVWSNVHDNDDRCPV